MTEHARFGPPGHRANVAKRAGVGLIPDAEFPGKYLCEDHGLRVERIGKVMKCGEGCNLRPPTG